MSAKKKNDQCVRHIPAALTRLLQRFPAERRRQTKLICAAPYLTRQSFSRDRAGGYVSSGASTRPRNPLWCGDRHQVECDAHTGHRRPPELAAESWRIDCAIDADRGARICVLALRLDHRACTCTMRHAPSASLRSNVQFRADLRSPPPTFGVHAALPEQFARAVFPATSTLQFCSATRCDVRLSNARVSAR